VNERISVTVALSVTVDPQSWYSRFHADPGIDVPDRMLSHLRTLPGIRDTGGKVELRRLIRRGSRRCRQSAQHRGVEESAVHKWALKSLTLPHMARLSAGHSRALCRHISAIMQTMPALFPDRRIPNEPSADFL
jgi:hypothetical protein